MARAVRAAVRSGRVVITPTKTRWGPTKEGIEAMAKVGPLGWRYSPAGREPRFEALLASTENVKPGYVIGYPGSSIPLANCAPAFTSPTRSWVMGSPGYGSGAGRFVGNKVVKVPLRKDYSHDVEAMIKADPNAGAYYICNPNNPTGTLTLAQGFRIYPGQQERRTRSSSSTRPMSTSPVRENYVHRSGAAG